MWSGLPKILFLVTLAANFVLWSQSRYGQIATSGTRSRGGGLLTRSLFNVDSVHSEYLSFGGDGDQCLPVTFPTDQQCTVVQNSCPTSDTFLSIPYLQKYFCADLSLRALIFTGYLLWLFFLFSTLGISASDFFCPNLSTLSRILGLDENVAGVTFLAFGNGSPDVFSTFSAMRTNSGGLAIGELLGAAAFVTSCVVGSMCIIRPFKVDRGPFLRDVGFFTLAVIVLLVVLWDSKIEEWEAVSLIGLYIFYVTVVVVGSYVERRRERRRLLEEMMRDEYREEVVSPYRDETPYSDQPSPSTTVASSLQVPSFTRARAISNPAPPHLGLELPPRPHTRSPSPQQMPHVTPHTSHMPSFSLVGALEFRNAIASLQQQAAGPSLNIFESPVSPYPGGHYHNHTLPRSRPRSPLSMNQDLDVWDASSGVPLDDRSPPVHAPQLSEEGMYGETPIPEISITHTPASPASEIESDAESLRYIPPSKRQRALHICGHVCHILFPTLQDFRSKSFLSKIASVFAAPAVMALTLTLPVVVTDYNGDDPSEEKMPGDEGRLIDFEEEGVERTLVAEEEVEREMHVLKFNKWLMAIQCILGPLFCVGVLFDGMANEGWILLATSVSGITVAILVAVFAKRTESSVARLARCSMGFIVSIVWIMAIADEVVQVLQTFGLIFGLSDAIIGLTVFAVGNSLADLVANMSVAVFAPIMGFSACFGGPMLNILLGIGISGSYIIRQTGEPYFLDFSTTLIITGTGLLVFLLVTLIFVPWNGYFLPRAWGVALIGAYVALMTANVVVEVTS